MITILQYFYEYFLNAYGNPVYRLSIFVLSKPYCFLINVSYVFKMFTSKLNYVNRKFEKYHLC